MFKNPSLVQRRFVTSPRGQQGLPLTPKKTIIGLTSSKNQSAGDINHSNNKRMLAATPCGCDPAAPVGLTGYENYDIPKHITKQVCF
jgi:hypothetical protein